MGWESGDVVRFDLESLLQGQTNIAKLKSAYNFPLFTPIEKTNVVAVLAFLLNLLLILKPFIPLSSPPVKITLSVSLLMGVACFLGSFTGPLPHL